ncbi:hypothetical protein [Altererythrobacter lutimaris]|uniref:Uncharacterized protein n=1 Tax=Altererythrobacter lutimaris TaxID=2743979 RepID=A0A850HHX1_9SPHN|nr:hypothetical protein [Altererythrobacter lutimaris]NVE94922.1 hypothetical protein [Altererythrobacter lutimaris]
MNIDENCRSANDPNAAEIRLTKHCQRPAGTPWWDFGTEKTVRKGPIWIICFIARWAVSPMKLMPETKCQYLRLRHIGSIRKLVLWNYMAKVSHEIDTKHIKRLAAGKGTLFNEGSWWITILARQK